MTAENAGRYFVRIGGLVGELRSNGAAGTQNCLENTTARMWEYKTNVNGTVSSS